MTGATVSWLPPVTSPLPSKAVTKGGPDAGGPHPLPARAASKEGRRPGAGAGRLHEGQARELAEEELAEFRGKYAAKAALTPALRNVSLHQRAVLARKFEQELAPNLAGLTTVEVLERVRGAVDEVCAIFREGIKQWTQSPPTSPTP